LKVLCSGDRTWTDAELVRSILSRLPPGSIVVHGDQGDDEATVGLDRISGKVATSLGLEVRPYPADWNRFGRRAGPFRNDQMVRNEKPDHVYAFHDDIEGSKGTKDLISKALTAKIPVTLVTHDHPEGMTVVRVTR